MSELILVLLGFAGAFVSGLLGVGGAIVLIPLLLYVPPALGLAGYSIAQVAGMTMVQVLVASTLGMLSHRRKGHLSLRLAAPMAVASGLGAILGGLGSAFAPEHLLSAVFAGLALLAGALMLVPVPERAEPGEGLEGAQWSLGVTMAGGVGILSGMVGAGGAFLMSPLMRLGLRLPIRVVIATSLAIVFASGLMGTIGKALTGQILWSETLMVVGGAVLGAPLGAMVSHRVQGRVLQGLLAVAIMGSGLRMAWQLLFER